MCIGSVCQESEDLSISLSISRLWIDMFHLIFDYLGHVVVRSLLKQMSAVALCSGP